MVSEGLSGTRIRTKRGFRLKMVQQSKQQYQDLSRMIYVAWDQRLSHPQITRESAYTLKPRLFS